MLVTSLLILYFVFCVSGSALSEEVWKITSLNWEPYSGAELSNQGNSIQKLREALRAKGIRLVVEFYPWKRAQKLAGTKDYIGYFPAWPEEVSTGFVASPAVDVSEISLMKRSDNTVIYTGINDLFKNYKVGIIKTYVYPKEITDAMEKYPSNVDETPNELSLLRKLVNGRNSVAITDPNVMLYLAGKEGLSNVESLKVIMNKDLVVSLRDEPDNKKRIALLNKLFAK